MGSECTHWATHTSFERLHRPSPLSLWAPPTLPGEKFSLHSITQVSVIILLIPVVKEVLEMSSQLRKSFTKLTKPPSALLGLLGNGNVAKG